MKYKMKIGFERYTETFEIEAPVYEKYARWEFEIGYNNTLKIETLDGFLFIKRIDLKFLRVYKEAE